jgi:CPA1 family monovalent cation:H+ antiporter
MEDLFEIESLIVLLVLIATLVAIAVRRIRLPHTVALVLVGLAITVRQPLDIIELTPELILSLFVPPLIFEAAFHLDLRLLRENLSSILVLAVPGVLISALLVGGIVSLATGLPIATAIVFGALIAATDPVAVVALFRELGVPRRLATAVEGESLFNDGTAIVIFQIALGVALTGNFDPTRGVFDFFEIAFGGMAVGLALGWLVAQLIARIDDRLIASTLTTLLAYGAFILAELLHVSGVLAVVIAGILAGNLGTSRSSPTTKNMIFTLWEFLGFIANSIVFLLIGLEVDLAELWADLGPIAAAVLAVLVSRALVVYGFNWLISLVRGRPQMHSTWRHVFFWGGLRGAISLALALSLPTALGNRQTLLSMAFGVLLFTLMVQGTTIRSLLGRLGLTRRPDHIYQRERALARTLAVQGGLRRLEQMRQNGIMHDEIWMALRDDYLEEQTELTEKMSDLFVDHAELEREALLQAQREALLGEQSALLDALRQGLISDEVFSELRSEVDKRLEAMDLLRAIIQRTTASMEGESNS